MNASVIPPVADDFTMEQPWRDYSDDDHQLWRELFRRQAALLPGIACDEYIAGLDQLGVAADRIPRFDALNEVLTTATGWRLVAVPGLVPDGIFFEHLAHRRFPVTWWIRRREQLDYLQEPDVFHDLFGHVPMLMNPVFGDYMQAYGLGGLKALTLGALPQLARLYWYTVEFGLIRTSGGLRIYGSGILSSKGESLYALESPTPRLAFDLKRILRTRYRIDAFQQNYFVIDCFEQLFEETRVDFTAYYREIAPLPEIDPGCVLEGDVLVDAFRIKLQSVRPGSRDK